ncbi:MAG: PTS sugar transporter subunit IIA [Myxococcales bacterium]|jgi:PTS system fructose-specific IIC component
MDHAAPLTALVAHPSPLLALAVVLVAGLLMGRAVRVVGLPSVTGQILGGMLIGPIGLNLFPEHAFTNLRPVVDLALGIIVVSIGRHLDLRRIAVAGRRITLIALSDAVVTLGVIFAALSLVFASLDRIERLLYAAIAIAPAPATVLHLVREKRARGVFVKTLLAVVAIANVLAILAFEFVRAFGLETTVGVEKWLAVLGPICLAAALGLGFALLTSIAGDRLSRSGVFSLVFVSVLLMVGVAELAGLSSLLACLVYGAALASISHNDCQAFEVLEDSEGVLFAAFFTLAGTHLNASQLLAAGAVGAVIFGARILAKVLAVRLAGRFAHAPAVVTRHLGLALVPQAGIAVGLSLVVQADMRFAAFAGTLTTTVLGVVVANELLGPILTSRAITKSGEAGRDRLRLVNFLEEEHIVVGLEAGSMTEAIERLAKTLFRVHRVKRSARAAILASVLERERQESTYLEKGIAIPHGVYEGGPDIIGVVGVSREGIPADTHDGQPIRLVILVATPDDRRDQHLEMLAAVAKVFGHHEETREAVFAARNAAEVHTLLAREEIGSMNPYLE